MSGVGSSRIIYGTADSGVFPTTRFAYQKGLGTCDPFLSHTLQSAFESGQEARVIQINFSAAFDRVTIRDFSISSVFSVKELYVVFIDKNFHQIVHIMFWWTLVGVNWLT